MADETDPKPLSTDDLDTVQAGGLLDTEAGGFGAKAKRRSRPAHTPEWTNLNDSDPGYVGETEKNVWKAPAGLTHDPVFEE